MLGEQRHETLAHAARRAENGGRDSLALVLEHDTHGFCACLYWIQPCIVHFTNSETS